LKRITANGGEIIKSPYPEEDLLVATFLDPAGQYHWRPAKGEELSNQFSGVSGKRLQWSPR
jgi:hypothetical protein